MKLYSVLMIIRLRYNNIFDYFNQKKIKKRENEHYPSLFEECVILGLEVL